MHCLMNNESASISISLIQEDFNRCLEIMMGSCKRKRFLKVTSVVGEGSRCSGVFHRPGKEPMVESTETMEASERGPVMEPVVESSEAMDVPRRRPGKEPVVESSETRLKEETVLEISQTIDLILRGLGLVPMPEISEVPEEMQSEWMNLLDKARRWSKAPNQRVPLISEITEEPVPRNENILNFGLEWLTEEEAAMANEFIESLRLAASASRNVSSHVAEAEDITRSAADFARGTRAEREGTHRHSAGSDRGARTERINFAVCSAASDRGARAVQSDVVVRRAVSDRGTTAEGHDADRHGTEGNRSATAERHDADRRSTEGDRHATAEPDNTSLHKCCKLQ